MILDGFGQGRPLQNKITPAFVEAPRGYNARPPQQPHRRPSPMEGHKEISSSERSRYQNYKRQRSPQKHWREVSHTQVHEHPVHNSEATSRPPTHQQNLSQDARPPLERNLAISDFPIDARIPTTEQVMNELREATYPVAEPPWREGGQLTHVKPINIKFYVHLQCCCCGKLVKISKFDPHVMGSTLIYVIFYL